MTRKAPNSLNAAMCEETRGVQKPTTERKNATFYVVYS